MLSARLEYTFLLLLLPAIYGTSPLHAQTAPVSVDWQTLADSTLGKAINDGDLPGAVVVIVNRDETLFTASFGISRLDTQSLVTDTTLFQVGSIGKVLTTIAVLQQVERGRLDLSEDINAYLAGWKVDAPGDKPLTLHHLLTHSGGLNARAIGYAARRPEDVSSLAAHLAENFPPFFAEPGKYISYSNYGFGLAGYAVETVTGSPFATYVSNEILDPLGIRASGYRPSEDADLAVGYRRQGDRYVSFPALYRPVTPAGSFVASAQEMGKLMRALLNDGAPFLSRESVEWMTQVRKSMHPALMGNAYGLEESRWGTIQGFGKGGSIPGFVAFMALLPDQGLGLFVAVNGPSDESIDRFVLAAMNQLSRDPGPVSSLPTMAPDLSRFVGEYRSNRYDRTSLEKLLNFEVHQINATGDGNLAMWHDGKMNVYRPVAPTLFQHTENPHRMVYFELGDARKTTHAFFNDRIAGGYVPVVWEKNGFWNSNLYVNEYFGFALIVGLSYLLLPVVALAVALVRRRRRKAEPHQHVGRWMHGVGFLTSASLLAYTLFYFIPLLRSRSELVFGIPETLTPWEILPMFIIAGFAIYAVLWVSSVQRVNSGRLALVFGFLFLISGILVCEFCLRWNLV